MQSRAARLLALHCLALLRDMKSLAGPIVACVPPAPEISEHHGQVRRRDTESREVMIEERRYDKAGQESAPVSSQSAREAANVFSNMAESLDLVAGDEAASPSALPLQTLGGGFGSSFADDEASDNPYAWAQRLRDIPDKARL